MKINIQNRKKIEEELYRNQEKYRARTLNYEDIIEACENAEKKLEDIGIPKKSRSGCQVLMDTEKVPLSYKYTASGTSAILQKGSKDWFLITVYRQICESCAHGEGRINRLRLEFII